MSDQDHSHARRNPLTGEWVLVSPQRLSRPWDGQIEQPAIDEKQTYEAGCYLCPGNRRANNQENPDYVGAYVFDNDFPALSAGDSAGLSNGPLFESRNETGCCRVVCYSEQHNQRLATMTVKDISAAIDSLVTEFNTLDALDNVSYVQIFENRGEMMGCSNQHPHAQIWATEHLPVEPQKELRCQQEYFADYGSALLRDYLTAELETRTRLVAENAHFVALVPYWAVWPFETLILPRDAMASPAQMNADHVRCLAAIWRTVFSAYDRLFNVQAPYSMGLHPRPSDGMEHPEWQFHIHVYPPLLRSASVRKHMVGFEMLAMPQRDQTPEVAAKTLRDLCTTTCPSEYTE